MERSEAGDECPGAPGQDDHAAPGALQCPVARPLDARGQDSALAIPGRLELPTYGLGNRRSIRLSYGTGEPHRAMQCPEMPYQSERTVANQ